METQLALDLEAARRGRDVGAERAAEHAERVEPGWLADAYAFLVDRVARTDDEFSCEDVRLAAEAAGLPPPPDRRAWGQLMLRAVRSGLIRRIGFGTMRSANCHASIKSRWIRVR